MIWTLRRVCSAILLFCVACAIGTSRVHAQGVGASRSLGGYGANSSIAMASMRSSSPMIPYAGNFGGFMPYRMPGGGGSGVSFSPRGSSVMGSGRTSFSLAPMSGGMRTGFGTRARSFDPFQSRAVMGLGADRPMSRLLEGPSRSDVMPPNFGYPFYQPPSLFSPASSAAGMSM
jgi:hypothetical protein